MMNDLGFDIRLLGQNDLEGVLRLQEVAFAQLENPELLRRNSCEMLTRCLKAPHCSIGAFDGGALMAVAIMYDPVDEPDEDLSHLSACNDGAVRSANFKLCIVHPDYRGHHLQQTLGLRLAKEARKRGIGRLYATVSPLNAASSKSLMRIGYRLDSHVEKYGYRRDLYVCDLEK